MPRKKNNRARLVDFILKLRGKASEEEMKMQKKKLFIVISSIFVSFLVAGNKAWKIVILFFPSLLSPFSCPPSFLSFLYIVHRFVSGAGWKETIYENSLLNRYFFFLPLLFFKADIFFWRLSGSLFNIFILHFRIFSLTDR